LEAPPHKKKWAPNLYSSSSLDLTEKWLSTGKRTYRRFCAGTACAHARMRFCKMFTNGLEPPLAHVGPLTRWLVLKLARTFNNDVQVLLMLDASTTTEHRSIRYCGKTLRNNKRN
jgi:hypothetical protein